MHEFRYKNHELFCEELKVRDIAQKIGTPFYLYSYKTIIDHYRKIKEAFSEVSPLICFSMKSNSNLAICKALVNEGAGLDIVSGGELYKALKVDVNQKKIVYASVGKTLNEIKTAIKNNILLFNVESIPELELINKVAKALNKKVEVSLRLNPEVEPDTHYYIKTAKKDSKFGIDFKTAETVFLNRNKYVNLNIVGIHLHIGSQITQSKPFVKAINRAVVLVKKLEEQGVKLKYLNIGGGLGIIYDREKPQTAQEFAKAVIPILKRVNLKIILEPGRFIVGNAGILVTKITYIKKTQAKKFAIVDSGMNDLIRPSLYEAYHEILLLHEKKGPKFKYDIVGPICESADFFGKDRRMPELKLGDYLAIMSAGAYGFSMSSNYNSRPRCAEVMVVRDKFFVIRKRENYVDLIHHENIPLFLKGQLWGK